MNEKTIEEQIFNLIEPALKKGAEGKWNRYRTSRGSKTKIGLLSCMRKIIDEVTMKVKMP